MARVALLSLHTSPLAQPGVGDSGGMNVYVRELAAGLAHAGHDCRVFVRTDREGLTEPIAVEPGVAVEHVPAGPLDLPKEALLSIIDEWVDAVAGAIAEGGGADVIHANYWLSAVAGHQLKHRLGVPLVATFHTLARVKAATGDPEPEARALAEQQVIDCADAVLASCPAEVEQLTRLYHAPRSRLAVVAPGVEHALFSPGPRDGARAAWPELGLGDRPVVLFVGRIQPLKGLDLAVRALAAMEDPRAVLVVVGGPSGAEGRAHLDEIMKDAAAAGVSDRLRFLDPRPHHELSTLYRAADAVVVPSRSESFGLVALEAAACGRPVVAAHVGGLSSLVEHGRTGYLLGSREPVRWASALDAAVARSPRTLRMGRAAASRALGYRWDRAAAALAGVYATVTDRGPLDCAA